MKPLGRIHRRHGCSERVYAAFNARDIEGALALMHPDVDWPNGWEGGREVGREAVRDYWTRQWHADRLARRAARLHGGAGRTRSPSTSTRPSATYNGNVLSDGRVTHVYTLRDGLVMRMDIVARG